MRMYSTVKVEVLSGIQRAFILSRHLASMESEVKPGMWLQPNAEGKMVIPEATEIAGPFYMSITDTLQPSTIVTGAVALLASPAYIVTDQWDIEVDDIVPGLALTVGDGGVLVKKEVTDTLVGYLDHVEGDTWAYVRTTY